MKLSNVTILRVLSALCTTAVGACAAPADDSIAATHAPTPAANDEPELGAGESPRAEDSAAPTRDQEIVVVMPAQPKPLADVAPSYEPSVTREQGGEKLGTSSQALYTYTGEAADPSQAYLTLYVVDGSGSGSGSYPVTSSIYSRFAGTKYYVQGPGTYLQSSQEILTNLASKMYWDCWNGHRDAALAGYSRGAYYTLEAHRWATVWGCAPTVHAALFVDPVDTLIWGFNHTVPDDANVRIARKNGWYDQWATIFANGAILGGRQWVVYEALSHPAMGNAGYVADDAVYYGRAFLGWSAFSW